MAAAVVALLALAGLLWLAVPSHETTLGVIPSAGAAEHRIDLLALVYKTTAEHDFEIKDGVTTKTMELLLDRSRRVRIAPGTSGEVSCPKMGELLQCAVAADLLGDAVVWFSLIAAPARTTLTLPAIVELRRNNDVLLANGWELKRSSTVIRDCGDDQATLTLKEIVDRYGAKASSTFNYLTQQVVKVTCPNVPITEDSSPESTEVDDSTPDGTIAEGILDTSPDNGEDVPATEVSVPPTAAATSVA